MPPPTITQAFADAVAALVGEPDVADVLHHLVSDCAEVMGADAVAILAKDDSGQLSLLSASSHRATELEILQIQHSAGPCVDVLHSSEALFVSGGADIRARWGDVGRAITDAGFDSVAAFPLRWRGTVLGGLNVFSSSASATSPGADIGQAFADIATLAVIYAMPVPTEQAAAQLHAALGAREQVEQAKGVIAYLEGVDMGTAYDLLVQRAERTGETLTRTASSVISEQRRPPGRP